MLSAGELSDHVAIGQLLQSYADALDAKEFERLDRFFADDAEIDYALGAHVTRGTWRENRDMFARFLDVFAYTSHLVSPASLALEGDSARSRTRLVAVHGFETLAGTKGTWVVFGFYDDELVRTAAGWRVRKRRFVGLGEQGVVPPRGELRRQRARK
jgi:3-phenylpropionate/cinnamic acid dioxygenase small subunit